MYGIGQHVSFVLEKMTDLARGIRPRARLRAAGGPLRVLGVYIGVPTLCMACLAVSGLAFEATLHPKAERIAEAPIQPRKQASEPIPESQEQKKPDPDGRRVRAAAEATLQAAIDPDTPLEIALGEAGPAVREQARVLDSDDARRYRQIFTLQRDGGSRLAARLSKKVKDRSLMDHVLADRYLRQRRPGYRSVTKWLGENRDHPDAYRLYETAKRVKPKRAKRPHKPLLKNDSLIAEPPPPKPHWSKRNNTKKQRKRVRYLKKTLRIWFSEGKVRQAEKLVNRREVLRLFDQYELDQARAKLAGALYYKGKFKKAYKYSARAIVRSGEHHPIAYWTAGLAAWRLGKITQAARHFRSLASRKDVSIWSRAGGAFWAARAYGRLRKTRDERRWLLAAAQYPMTIYGQIAAAQLGSSLRFATRAPLPSREVLAPLLRTERGRRAMALLQIGETRRAEHELLRMQKWRSTGIAEALFSLGAHAGMPAIGVKLAKRLPDSALSNPDGGQVEAAYYPIPPWRALEKSRVDRALLYAVMRQESSFYSLARSPVGAKGLMQIMPQTAKDLSSYSRFRRMRPLDRYNPATSVALGQTYIEQIMRQRDIGTDLIRVIAAYNAGIGNVRHWAKRIGRGKDPLLFIESLPNLETRLFVRRVLTNFWIYRARLGQDRPTLAQIAEGGFPQYRQLDPKDPPRTVRVRVIRPAPSAQNGLDPAG